MFGYVANFLWCTGTFDGRCWKCEDNIATFEMFKCVQMAINIFWWIDWCDISIWNRKRFLQTGNLFIITKISISIQIQWTQRNQHYYLSIAELQTNGNDENIIWNGVTLFGDHFISIRIEFSCSIFDPFGFFRQHRWHTASWLWKCFHTAPDHCEHGLKFIETNLLKKIVLKTKIFLKKKYQNEKNHRSSKEHPAVKYLIVMIIGRLQNECIIFSVIRW